MTGDIFSEEGEVWILSGMLSGGTSYLDEHISKLQSSHFLKRTYRLLFGAIKNIYENGSPVNTMTVSNFVKNNSILEDSESDYLIHKLATAAPTTAHADHWIKVLEDK